MSPLVYGKRLQLNPVAVFVGVLFWWTLWGVPGALPAVPIIATAKVLVTISPTSARSASSSAADALARAGQVCPNLFCPSLSPLTPQARPC